MTRDRATAFWRYLFIALCITYSSSHAADAGSEKKPLGPPLATKMSASELQSNEKMQWELANVATKYASLEAAIAKSSERADVVADRTSKYSLLTVLGTAIVSAFLSLLIQRQMMRHQNELNRVELESEVANSYVEWQLRQLSELYGPVRALLGQSNVLYRQMNRALVAADSSRFRLVAGTGDYFDKQEFQIRIGQSWVRFRMVQHLAEIYGKGFGVEPYFDDVIDVGERLASVIRDKAGFVRSEDGELVLVMGRYLAHYFVLKRLRDAVRAGNSPHLNAADEEAVFPDQIHKLVDGGFNAINQQVIEWRGKKFPI